MCRGVFNRIFLDKLPYCMYLIPDVTRLLIKIIKWIIHVPVN